MWELSEHQTVPAATVRPTLQQHVEDHNVCPSAKKGLVAAEAAFCAQGLDVALVSAEYEGSGTREAVLGNMHDCASNPRG